MGRGQLWPEKQECFEFEFGAALRYYTTPKLFLLCSRSWNRTECFSFLRFRIGHQMVLFPAKDSGLAQSQDLHPGDPGTCLRLPAGWRFEFSGVPLTLHERNLLSL